MRDQVKSLADLGLTARAGREARVTGLAVDSREVKDGFLFAALPGTRVHGGEYIQYALRMGAAAILTDAEGAEIARAELAVSDAALVIAAVYAFSNLAADLCYGALNPRIRLA